MNRRKLFKCLLAAPFAVPAIAKAVDRLNKQRSLYAEHEEIYRRLQAIAVARHRSIWYSPHGLNRGDLQNLRGRTVYYVHLDEANFRLHELPH